MSQFHRIPYIVTLSLIICYITSPTVFACLYISELQPNPYDSKNEWVELFNNCTSEVNLSLISIEDDDSFSRALNGMTNETYIIAANDAGLFGEYFGVPSGTVVSLGYGSSWMNNDGDVIYLMNGTEMMDEVSYGNTGKNVSWALCDGMFVEVEIPTSGSENYCPEEINDTSQEGSGTVNITDETEDADFSGITISVSGPKEAVRFGDFTQISAELQTGRLRLPLRIVSYIYSPRWISTDLEGNTLRTYLNETKIALSMETKEDSDLIVLMLPLFLRENCDGDYEEGNYTGRVRVYLDGSDEIVTEETFEITLEGNNPLFCAEECPECDCPECEEKTCDCSGYSSSSSVTSEKSDLFKIVSFQDVVEAGEPFGTTIELRNDMGRSENFEIYSYAFDGSRCMTLGYDGDAWKKTWTSNEVTVDLNNGEKESVTLTNAFENGTNSSDYKFRVRVKYDGKNEDITRMISVVPRNVTETIEAEEEFQEEPENVTDAPITGMATAEEPVEDAPEIIEKGLFESLMSWLASLFKF